MFVGADTRLVQQLMEIQGLMCRSRLYQRANMARPRLGPVPVRLLLRLGGQTRWILHPCPERPAALSRVTRLLRTGRFVRRMTSKPRW